MYHTLNFFTPVSETSIKCLFPKTVPLTLPKYNGMEIISCKQVWLKLYQNSIIKPVEDIIQTYVKMICFLLIFCNFKGKTSVKSNMLMVGLQLTMSDSTSCSDRCNHDDKHTYQCDTECEVFGDCCVDFNTHCQVNVIPDVTTVRKNVSAHANLRDTVVRKNLSVCTTVYHNKDIEVGYIISNSPSSWSEPIMRSRCSSHSINIHVYDTYGYNYRNIYCAFCHNRTIEDI